MTKDATGKLQVQVLGWGHAFISLGQKHGNRYENPKDIFNFRRPNHTIFQTDATLSRFITNIWELHCSRSSPIFGTVSHSNFSHSSRFLVTYLGGFHLHFSNNYWCWISFFKYLFMFLLTIHISFFCVKYLIKSFAHYFNWVVFLLLGYESSSYRLDISLTCFLSIFAQLVAYLSFS